MWWTLLALSCASVPAGGSAPEVVASAAAPNLAPEEPAPPVEAVLEASDPWTLRAGAEAAGVAWPPPSLRLTIDKSSRALTAWSGEIALKRYRVGLGDPEGDKERQGDRRTPEGPLRVVTKNAQSNFHKFLGLSYPTSEDAARGLAAGLVTRAQADAIRAADAAGRRPPWETALGGLVGIHGGGGDWDWTLGCVAVTDEEIDELWEVVRIGTPVHIEP